MTTTTALILIDMQKGMQSNTLPPWNSRSPRSVFAPGQSGVEFQERFTPLANLHGEYAEVRSTEQVLRPA